MYQARKAYPAQTVTFEAYVPNRTRDGAVVHNHAQWVRLVEDAVCGLTGGGCTTYEARGRWGQTYEQTTIVRGTAPWLAQLAAHALVETLGRFADECQQDVAGYTLDGEWYYVGRETALVTADAEATA